MISVQYGQDCGKRHWSIQALVEVLICQICICFMCILFRSFFSTLPFLHFMWRCLCIQVQSPLPAIFGCPEPQHTKSTEYSNGSVCIFQASLTSALCYFFLIDMTLYTAAPEIKNHLSMDGSMGAGARFCPGGIWMELGLTRSAECWMVVFLLLKDY